MRMNRKLQIFFSMMLMMFIGTNVFAEEYSWDFSKKTYSEASEDKVVWESTFASITVDKAGATTKANNYLGGDENNRTSSRFYKGSTVTIAPEAGYAITSIEFECTTNDYATALVNSTWENATAGANGMVVTITPKDGTKPFVGTIGGTTGSRKVTLNYYAAGGVVPPTITPATGTYGDPQTVTITAGEGTTIYYSLNGGEYQTYTAPFSVEKTTTVKAYAEDASGTKSSEVESVITIASFIYTANFKNNAADFTVNDVKLGEGITYAWTNNSYGWVASAYAGGAAHEAESWLISPPFTIEAGADVILSFMHALNKGSREGAVSLWVSEDKENWTELTVPNWPAGTDWNFIESGDINLNAYIGKTIYIGFKYVSTTSNAPSWEISEFILQGKGSVTVETPTYNSIAEAKAAATATQVKSELNLSDVLVTYVNGASTYITDGTDGFLLYGSNLGLTAGQKVNLVADGNLYLYNGLPEQAVSSITFTLISDNNAVEPTVVEITDLLSAPLKYSNMLIKIEGCGIESEAWETVSNHGNVTLIQDGEETVLRDNWNVATDMTFKTDKDYNVTGFVAIHNENVQIYPRSAEDIQLITSQATPASKWMNGEEEITELSVTTLDADVSGVKFTTDSDGAVTYTSSDPEVATVSEAGVITLVGAGKAEIKATTAETEAFVESVKTLNITVLILEGDGTEDNPYTIADLRLLYDENQASEPVWVKGYIVGCANGSLNKVAWTTDDTENLVPSNVLFSDVEGTQNVDECIPVNLPAEKDAPGVRAMANLVDNPSNLGKLAKAYGTIEKYFSVAGLKNVKQFVIEGGEEVIPGDVNEDGDVNINDVVAIINQMAGTANWKNANVNGDPDGTVDINDVVAVINIMANN